MIVNGPGQPVGWPESTMGTPLSHHVGWPSFLAPPVGGSVWVAEAAGLSGPAVGKGSSQTCTGHSKVLGHFQLFFDYVAPGGVHSLPWTFAGTVQVGMGNGS